MDVLIVSCDDACVTTLAEVLGSGGHAAETAATMEEAQSRLNASSGGELPAVVVMDVDSATSRPQRFLSRLRARHPHGAVVVTGTDADAALLTDLIHLGIRDYIPKPFDPSAFAAIVREAAGSGGGFATAVQGPPGSRRAASETAAELVRANQQLKILNNSLRQHVSQLTILYQMGRDISETENWSDALDRFLMALVNYTNADGAALLLFSRSETRLAPRSNFQVDTGRLHDACDTLLSQWRDNPRGGEIHTIESYDDRVFSTCLERLKPWKFTVVPLRHRNRSLGFLVIEKLYRSGRRFKADYLFLNTIQTILAEEVANASYISELRQLGRFNRKVLENINSGVITTDLDGYVAYFNQLAVAFSLRAFRRELLPGRHGVRGRHASPRDPLHGKRFSDLPGTFEHFENV
ncbi:MAG: response regulator [bacterium]